MPRPCICCVSSVDGNIRFVHQGKSFEVNRRLVYDLRTLGKGYAGARKFCLVMNMPPPPTEKAFISNSCVIGRHIKWIAKETMKKAGKEVVFLQEAKQHPWSSTC